MKNDKPQFTLHKLPEGFIVTSDKNPCPNDIVLSTVTNTLVKFTDPRFFSDGTYFKVIAQQDQIDFPSLSPEIQKEIGWFDWLRIAILSEDEEIEKIGQEYHSRSWYKGVEFGFQKALELLSDRTFTKKDMFKLMEHLRDTESRMMFEVETRMFVSKPKSWRVELEMETVKGEYIGRRKIGVTPSGEPTYINEGYEEIEVPKLTDGKIKITKLW